MRIQILALPSEQSQSNFQYGGQNSKGGLQLNQTYNAQSESFSKDLFDSVSTTIQPVPREEATLEAEKNETLIRNMPNGALTQFVIGGKRHYAGGTPLKGENGDYIFSDTKKMELKGPILQFFGKPEDTKKAFTPAALAKQYDINKFQAIIDDPDTDKLQKSTAQRVINNFTQKLGTLAFVAEAKKSFPDGIPELTQRAQQEAQESQQSAPEATQVSKFGGKYKYQTGGQASIAGKSAFDPNILAPDRDPQYYDMSRTDNINSLDHSTNYFPTDNIEPIQHQYNYNINTPQTGNMDFQSPYILNPGSLPTVKKYSDIEKDGSETTPHPGSANIDNNSHIPFAYRNQDKMVMGLAAWQLANIKKYPAYVAPMQLTAPLVSLPGNEAEKASIAAGAQSEAMVGALSQEGTQQSANSSRYWGEALNRIQSSDAQTRNQQIAISNQGQKETADIQNKQAEFNSNRLSEMYKQGVISQQQYDNAIRQGQNNLMKTVEQSDDNRAHMSWVNSMNVGSGFQANPRTGNIQFTGQANQSGNQGKNDFGQTLAAYQKNIIDNNPGIDPNLAWKMADNQLRIDRSRKTYNPQNPKQTKISETSGDYGYGTGSNYITPYD